MRCLIEWSTSVLSPVVLLPPSSWLALAPGHIGKSTSSISTSIGDTVTFALLLFLDVDCERNRFLFLPAAPSSSSESLHISSASSIIFRSCSFLLAIYCSVTSSTPEELSESLLMLKISSSFPHSECTVLLSSASLPYSPLFEWLFGPSSAAF